MMISLSKLERQRKKEKERRKKEKNPKVYSSEEKERKESRETRAENFKLFGVLSSRVEISMEEKKIPKPPRSCWCTRWLAAVAQASQGLVLPLVSSTFSAGLFVVMISLTG
jgi:hypothetical protein